MKNNKLSSLILKCTLLIVIGVSILLFTACYLTVTKEDYDLSNITFNDLSVIYDGSEHELIINGELPARVSVFYINNKLTDVGTVEATAKFKGDRAHNPIPDMTATLTIEKADYDLTGVSFNDKTVTYDGTEHEIVITGTLPAGVTVSYTNNKLTNSGVATATATLTGSDSNHNPVNTTLTATLTIEKADYDLTGISFNNKTVTYDGTEHEIVITGTLPAGVTVSYKDNKLTNAGASTATANFTGDSNHNAIADMTATLTIEKADYDLSGISFNNKTVTYDGIEHEIVITGKLPAGVTVSYKDNKLTNAGVATATATLTGNDSNHNPVNTTLTATLTIEKADYDLSGVSFNNKTITYDGTEHEIVITGTLPAGITVSYKDNKLTNAGVATATATLTGSDSNHNPVNTTLTAVLTIEKADYDLTGISFNDKIITYDGTEHEIVISGSLPAGVTVSYTNNKLTNAGTTNATASFTGDSNHNTATMTATLTIEKADYDLTGISFSNLYIPYDGTEHEIVITGILPTGVTVSYTDNKLTDLGVKEATANLTGDSNHNPINITLTATLTIFNDSLSFTSGAGNTCTVSGITDKSVTKVVIPDYYNGEKVKSIGVYAFAKCLNLTAITIPKGVTAISDSAFSNCISLETITIPEGVTSIGYNAFEFCYELTTISIPDSVTSIGARAFYGCTSLKSITIPDKVTDIGNSAFYNCTSLETITIPDSVTFIDIGAFIGCANLKTIIFKGTKAQWNTINVGLGIKTGVVVKCKDGDITL